MPERAEHDERSPLRVALADDHEVVREAVKELLSGEPDIELVGLAEHAASIIELCRTSHVDVAVVDVRMPGGGPDAVTGILRASSSTRVVVYSAAADPATRREMLDAGASAFVPKGASVSELLSAIRG